MKNAKFELLGRMQRQFHRNHPWRLSQGGLYIRHSYAETKPDELTLWDDVGFILNRRRVIVWCKHPRLVYADAIQDLSSKEAGDAPEDNWFDDDRTASYKRVGKSRKKIVGHFLRESTDETKRYFGKHRDIEKRLQAEGIELDVSLSWKRKRMMDGDGISLVAPIEVSNETELAAVAKLARRLILGQTTLEAEFPEYRYGKADWLREQCPYPY